MEELKYELDEAANESDGVIGEELTADAVAAENGEEGGLTDLAADAVGQKTPGFEDTDGTCAEAASPLDCEKEIYELSYEATGGVGVEVNRERYAELRSLGLSAKEAFLATSARTERPSDNRAHLGSSVPRCATRPSSGISQRELKEAREIFDGASDAEILRLYRRVTAN